MTTVLDARAIPEAVLWHEGMLLAPQHFQEAARRTESLLAYRLAAACPFPWGIGRLEIDRARLADGLFRIDEIEAILPDGLVVVQPRDDEAPLELDLATPPNDVRSGARIVHLAVPALGTELAGQEAGRRYRSVEGAAVRDASTGEDPIEVPRLRPAPLLLLSDEAGRPPPRRWITLPVARVAFRDDLFVLEQFAPPRLRLARGTELHAIASGIAMLLREKAVAMAERLQAPGSELAADAGWEAVRALAGPLPRLEALLASGQAHPFDVYLALVDCAGSVAGLSRGSLPAQLQAYRHENALLAFAQVAEVIGREVGRLREPYRSLRFTRHGEGRFTIEPGAALARGELVLGVRGAPGTAPAALHRWIEDALIGSASELRAIRERRTLGAPRRAVDGVAELDLLPPRGVTLYRVGPDPAALRADEILEVQGRAHDGIEPVELLLFVAGEAARP